MQKTAYEMRISDWSSDVCSSDLLFGDRTVAQDHRHRYAEQVGLGLVRVGHEAAFEDVGRAGDLGQAAGDQAAGAGLRRRNRQAGLAATSEESRVGTECVSTGRARWSPYN